MNGTSVAVPPVEIVEGRVPIPTGPGIGVELDEAECERHPVVERDLKLLEDESILDRSVLPVVE